MLRDQLRLARILVMVEREKIKYNQCFRSFEEFLHANLAGDTSVSNKSSCNNPNHNLDSKSKEENAWSSSASRQVERQHVASINEQ